MKEQRFEVLDAWRGLCALVVALEHLSIDNVLHENALVRHGARFVDFFFVLSGFVIAHAYRDRLQAGRQVWTFLLRRIGRLWPLHATILVLLVIAELVLLGTAERGLSIGREPFSDRNLISALPSNVLLVHGWGLHDRLTWNTPSWSISAEMFAYVLFAAICVLVSRWRDLVLVACCLASMVVLLLAAPEIMGSTHDFGVARCVYGFALGALLRAFWTHYRPPSSTVLELGALVLVVGGVTLLPSDRVAVVITPIFALAVWVFASEGGAVSRALRRAGPQALGAWSYSIYMVHAPIVFAMLVGGTLLERNGYRVLVRLDGTLTFVGERWFTTVVVSAYLAAVIGVSGMTYRYVEAPARRWFRRRESGG